MRPYRQIFTCFTAMRAAVSPSIGSAVDRLLQAINLKQPHATDDSGGGNDKIVRLSLSIVALSKLDRLSRYICAATAEAN
jgi:hypothetical protein